MNWINWFDVATLFCACLAGVFDASMDARKDYPESSIFTTIGNPSFQSWYVGGNVIYPAEWNIFSFWRLGDFWHTAKMYLFISAFLAVVFVAYSAREGGNMIKFFVIAWLCFYLEGRVFVLFYHQLFKRDKPRTWSQT